MREYFREQRHGFCTRAARTSPQPASRRQGKIRDLCTGKIPQSRHLFARFARKGLPLYERKPSRRIRDRSEARECFADRATLCQLSAESWESSKKTMQSGLKVREHCCLASFRRRTGCSPSRWRSRRHEHKNLPKIFMRSVATGAKPNVSGAQG